MWRLLLVLTSPLVAGARPDHSSLAGHQARPECDSIAAAALAYAKRHLDTIGQPVVGGFPRDSTMATRAWLFDFEVTQPAVPVRAESMIEGRDLSFGMRTLVVQFVVDTLGRVEPATIRPLGPRLPGRWQTDSTFAVHTARDWTFQAATVSDRRCPVRQLRDARLRRP